MTYILLPINAASVDQMRASHISNPGHKHGNHGNHSNVGRNRDNNNNSSLESNSSPGINKIK